MPARSFCNGFDINQEKLNPSATPGNNPKEALLLQKGHTYDVFTARLYLSNEYTSTPPNHECLGFITALLLHSCRRGSHKLQ